MVRRGFLPGALCALVLSASGVVLAAGPEEERLLGSDREEQQFADLLPFTRALAVSGKVQGSLADSTSAAGVPPAAMLEALNALATTVDFGRELRDGDGFYVRWEQQFSIEGAPIGVGRVLWAELQLQFGPQHAADADGRTLDRELLFPAHVEAIAVAQLAAEIDGGRKRVQGFQHRSRRHARGRRRVGERALDLAADRERAREGQQVGELLLLAVAAEQALLLRPGGEHDTRRGQDERAQGARQETSPHHCSLHSYGLGVKSRTSRSASAICTGVIRAFRVA